MNVSRKILFISLLCISSANLFAMEEAPEKKVESLASRLQGQFNLAKPDIAKFKEDIPPIDFARIIDVSRFGIDGVDSIFRGWLSRLDGIMAMCAQTRMVILQPLVRGDDFVPFTLAEQKEFLQDRKADIGARAEALEKDLDSIVALEDIVVIKINELLAFMSRLISEQKAKAVAAERERLEAMAAQVERSRREYAEQVQAAEARRGVVKEVTEQFETGTFVTGPEPEKKVEKEAEKVKGDVGGCQTKVKSSAF